MALHIHTLGPSLFANHWIFIHPVLHLYLSMAGKTIHQQFTHDFTQAFSKKFVDNYKTRGDTCSVSNIVYVFVIEICALGVPSTSSLEVD